MPAYSFQKRFVPFVSAGLEPGGWLPGMKRHTLRVPRNGRVGHARPEQPVHLFTAMRTKHCRKIGLATAKALVPVTLIYHGEPHPLLLQRRAGACPRSHVCDLAPVVRRLIELPISGCLSGEQMDEIARSDGFRDAEEMRGFFDPPNAPCTLDLVLVAWAPREGCADAGE